MAVSRVTCFTGRILFNGQFKVYEYKFKIDHRIIIRYNLNKELWIENLFFDLSIFNELRKINPKHSCTYFCLRLNWELTVMVKRGLRIFQKIY